VITVVRDGGHHQGVGLTNMKDRLRVVGGVFEVESAPSKGDSDPGLCAAK
jgi:signal transduction histidine kinase